MTDAPVAYFKGEFVPASEANVNIQAKAFNYGIGCFEGIRAYYDEAEDVLRVFRAEDHYRRLLDSCRILQLTTDLSVEQMIEITDELLRRNECRCDAYVRPIVYSNSFSLSPIVTQAEENGFAMYIIKMRDYLDTKKGITACVSSWRRVSDNMIPARAKPTGVYLNSALARYEAKLNGFEEAIFLTNDGYVSEGSAEHLFLVRDGTLITPTSQEDNLEGVTRRSLIELAGELGYPVIERRVARTELYVAEEAFLCGTGAEVTPLVAVDRRVVGDGTAGPVTLALQDLYFKVAHGKVARFEHWCHTVAKARR